MSYIDVIHFKFIFYKIKMSYIDVIQSGLFQYALQGYFIGKKDYGISSYHS